VLDWETPAVSLHPNQNRSERFRNYSPHSRWNRPSF
jgi:hypothetical protein